MKNKNNEESTIDELNSKKRTLKSILFILGSLILLYGVYFVTKLFSGTWQANNTLGIVGLGTLGVLSSSISIQLSKIEKEIKSRNTNN